jgi:hypothetical protein
MKNSKYGSVRCYIKWQSTQIWSLEILGVIVTAQSSLQIQHTMRKCNISTIQQCAIFR